MQIGLEVIPETRALRDWSRDMVERQLPFATAVALTRSAQEGADVGRRRLFSYFDVRAKTFLRRGVPIVRAEKRDWPSPRATVALRDQFIAEHERGTTRRAKEGRHMAVPTALVRRTSRGVSKAQRPAKIIARKTGYIEDGRIGVRRGARARDRRQTFYTLHETVKIPHGLKFVRIVRRKLERVYPVHFDRELVAALRSMRVRPGSFTTAAGRAHYLKKRNQSL